MDKTPEMVRRVAEAMYDGFQRACAHNFGSDWTPIPFAETDMQCRRFYCSAAREGIQAMRVATKHMSDAGWTASETADRNWQSCTPRELWAAMIDAALAAPDEGEGL